MREMEACWPSGVGPAGVGVKPPGAALAEDRRGERSGRRLGLTRSGGDQEGVPEAFGLAVAGRVSLLRRRNSLDGIETGEYLHSRDEPGGCPWLLARWCPAWRRREPGLRLLHGT